MAGKAQNKFIDMVLRAAQTTNVRILDASELTRSHFHPDNSTSMGCLTFDFLLRGGLPDGRFHIVYGPSGAGKTTFTSRAMAMAQSQKRPVVHIDAEYAVDSVYMKQLGLDMQNGANYSYVQPVSGEGAFQLIHRITDAWTAEYGSELRGPLFVIDSLKALAVEMQLEDDSKNPIALQARMFSNFMPMVKSSLGQTNSTLLAVNQVRQNPGQMFGNPETMPGGEALTFFADTILRLSRVGKVEEDELGTSQVMRMMIKKCKHVLGGATTDMKLLHGLGYDPRADIWLFMEASGMGVAERGWYTMSPYDGIELPPGLEADKRYRINELLPYMLPAPGMHYATAPLYAWAANLIWSGKIHKAIQAFNDATEVEEQKVNVGAGHSNFDFSSLMKKNFDIGKFKAHSKQEEAVHEHDDGSGAVRKYNIGSEYPSEQWDTFVGYDCLSTAYGSEDACTVNSVNVDEATMEVTWHDGGEIEEVGVDTMYYIAPASEVKTAKAGAAAEAEALAE